MSGVWLRDLVKVLRQAGVEVEGLTYKYGRYAGKRWHEVGWNGLGYRELRGVLWHHDASPEGDSPGALQWCMYSELAPCAAIWVDRRGKWWVYAGGQTNHAGVGASPIAPNSTGNQYLLGIETDHTLGERWEKAQLDSLRRGTAAIMKHYGLDPMKALDFHKDYALPPGRKNDPDGLSRSRERKRVARLMGTAPSGWRGLLDRWTSILK